MNETVDSTAQTLPYEADAYSLAAGLLALDFRFLLVCYPILAAPNFLAVLWGYAEIQSEAVQLIAQVFQIGFAFFVGRRWISALSHKKHVPGFRTFMFYIFYGLFSWIIVVGPLLLFQSGDQAQSAAFLILLLPGALLVFRYYFYFAPLLLGIHGLQEVLVSARQFTLRDKFMPIKMMVAPFALSSFVVLFIMAAAPDGRELSVSLFAAFFLDLYSLLNTYLTLAFALTLYSSKDWREAELDPYRESRLKTLSTFGPRALSNLLKPSRGFLYLALSLIVFYMNQLRVYQDGPAANIKVDRILIQESEVTLELSLSDPEYNFRGFRPYFLALAGEKRAVIAKTPEELVLDGQKIDGWQQPSPELSERKLKVRFKTARSKESLSSLTDLYLWYQGKKITRLDMEKAEIDEGSRATELTASSP